MTNALDRQLHDEEGYLVDPECWTEDIAWRISAGEGLALTGEHWRLIRCMRGRYAERQVAPDARVVVKFMADDLGYGPRARARLCELFPYGYVKQACKVAGMKRPRAWSTG